MKPESTSPKGPFNLGKKLPTKDPKVDALSRIAAAVETMDKNNQQLVIDVEWWKLQAEVKGAEIANLKLSVASYKGQVTKLKKKLGLI